MRVNPFARLKPVPVILFAVILVLDLIAGIYHLTHRGVGSGITELILAILFVKVIYPVLPVRQGEAPQEKSYRYRKKARVIIAAAVAIMLYLGIYHLTHDGLRSGIIELSMAVMLAGLGCLIRRSQRG